jgi:Ca-activated chloride channel family protein
MRKKIGIGLCLIFTLFLCACSNLSGKLLIMQANFHNSRGSYTEAISSYMKAHEYPDTAPYAEYGLGTVYFTLGEEKAARERFAEAERMLEVLGPAAGRELQYRIHYNTGIVLFSGGNFSGAVESFRSALKIDGGKKEAKRNLELSIRSLERENRSGGGKNDGQSESESRSAIFEYIQQKEINQWKSREWTMEEEINGPDY